MQSSQTEYKSRLSDREAVISQLDQTHARYGYAKLAAAIAAVATVWRALSASTFSAAWALLPVAVFAVLLVLHNRMMRRLEQVRRRATYYKRALDRLDGKWEGTGSPGDCYADPHHPYAIDLDLFGKASLFELLCAARTAIGESTLAGWLLAPAAPAVVLARQQGVEELRERLDLREDLAVLAEDARTGVKPEALAAWGETPAALPSHRFRWALALHSAAGLLALGAGFLVAAGMGGALSLNATVYAVARDYFLVALLANLWFLRRIRRRVEAVTSAVEEAAHELALLAELLVRLEQEQFTSPVLSALRASLDSGGEPPSRRLASLRRLVEYIDSRDNVFVRLLEPFLLWTPHLAVRIEDWRRISGPSVRPWLTATGEIEALCSLACYAFEHPADPFPEFLDGAARLEAIEIAHPLIHPSTAVANSLTLGSEPRLVVVSGSNMSGKSTLLRTLGINVVLAQAGAPVRARALRLTPLSTGASIRISDSLHEGISRFYAEILRLRQILDLTAQSGHTLFLVDEILHGTNSHDRKTGAEAIVRGLMQRGGIGLITTHDLALADVAGTLGAQATNMHFEDRIGEDGRIRFDYELHPGVVQHSNAITLMRSVGLEI